MVKKLSESGDYNDALNLEIDRANYNAWMRVYPHFVIGEGWCI